MARKSIRGEYVPVLKAKAGELWSLQHLSNRARALTTPVLELVPPNKKQTDESRVVSLINELAEWWPLPVYLEFRFRDGVRIGDRHIVTRTFDDARKSGVHAIPVTAPGRTGDYQQAVRSAAQ